MDSNCKIGKQQQIENEDRGGVRILSMVEYDKNVAGETIVLCWCCKDFFGLFRLII